jgi:hypothetical protein
MLCNIFTTTAQFSIPSDGIDKFLDHEKRRPKRLGRPLRIAFSEN